MYLNKTHISTLFGLGIKVYQPVFVFYCFITNYHELGSEKYLLLDSTHGSRIWHVLTDTSTVPQ